MQRAALLIGVQKTGGGFPALQAVDSGLRRFRSWAAAQPGMGTVAVLSDAGGRAVSCAHVRAAITRLADRGDVGQLLVYFAGHGVNVRFNEYWLLSGAPDDPAEAVNVAGSVELAEYCGIPHVALFSDACRTAADTIQLQAVTGSLVFPNKGRFDQRGRVDVFYATRVGHPALEVKDANAAAAAFEAIFTAALVSGLDGSRADLVEREDGGAASVGRVRCWPLRDYLETEVPKLLIRRGASLDVAQVPDADITSRPTAWLSELPVAPSHDGGATARDGADAEAPGGGGRGGAPDAGAGPARPPERSVASTLRALTQRVVRAALEGKLPRGQPPGYTNHDVGASASRRMPRWYARDDARGSEFFHASLAQAVDLGPLGHHETECGFRVTGATITEALSAGATVEVLGEHRVRVEVYGGRAASVLLVLGDRRALLLPAIPRFIAGLTYADGELVNVSYEPSDNTPLWGEMQGELDNLRELRGITAAAARLGVFRLEQPEDTRALLERMRSLGGLDPTMALYSAYALHGRRDREALREIASQQREALRMSLFDVAMFAREPTTDGEPMPSGVYPAAPLLSQGWALLGARGVVLPAHLRDAQRHLAPSFWTVFEPPAVDALRDAIGAGEVR